MARRRTRARASQTIRCPVPPHFAPPSSYRLRDRTQNLLLHRFILTLFPQFLRLRYITVRIVFGRFLALLDRFVSFLVFGYAFEADVRFGVGSRVFWFRVGRGGRRTRHRERTSHVRTS